MELESPTTGCGTACQHCSWIPIRECLEISMVSNSESLYFGFYMPTSVSQQRAIHPFGICAGNETRLGFSCRSTGICSGFEPAYVYWIRTRHRLSIEFYPSPSKQIPTYIPTYEPPHIRPRHDRHGPFLPFAVPISMRTLASNSPLLLAFNFFQAPPLPSPNHNLPIPTKAKKSKQEDNKTYQSNGIGTAPPHAPNTVPTAAPHTSSPGSAAPLTSLHILPSTPWT